MPASDRVDSLDWMGDEPEAWRTTKEDALVPVSAGGLPDPRIRDRPSP